MPKNEIDVVYIIGDSRSGSTLLQTLLGSGSEFLVAGEVRRLVLDGAGEVGCSCRKNVESCEYWTGLLNSSAFDGKVDRGANTIGRRLNQVISLCFLALRVEIPKWMARLLPDKTAVRAATLLGKLARKGLVVIDASKVPLHFVALRALEGSRIFPVFLRRDGRAVVFSKMKHGNLTVMDAVAQWRNSLLSMELTRWLFPGDQQLVIRYEDLCKDPIGTVNGVRLALGMSEVVFRSEDIDKGAFHFIGGSPSFGDSSSLAVKLDEDWRKEMHETDLHYFNSKVGWLNRLTGYRESGE